MCGIAGVLGRAGAPRLVRHALEALEYRGYDSCGVAWPQEGAVQVVRAVGAVAGLAVPDAPAAAALGHTRWATHGGVTEANAHPHVDCTGRVAVVHNGVLSNHEAVRAALQASGHALRSQTDSEALVHLWEEARGSGLERLGALRGRLQGTYSLAILDAAEEALYVAKERNPLWLARGEGATWLASDPVALRAHAAEAVPLEDGDHGRLTAAGWDLRDASGRPVQRKAHPLAHLDERADKAGYEHYMLKEIHEAPAVLNRLLARHVHIEGPLVDLGVPAAFLAGPRRVLALGAGTSHHAAQLTALWLQRLARLPAEAKATPEYKDDPHVPEPGTLLVAFSQSGETLDTLQALHRLRSHPSPTLALTNQPSSSLGRQADHTVPLLAGTEVSVAATKTFLAQALLGHLLALAKGRVDGSLTDGELAVHAGRLRRLPRHVERTLLRTPALAELARRLAGSENLFVLAKGLLLPAAQEGALKLKEIAYQHAEAYPAGELKHGPFALLSASTPVLFLHAPGPHEDALLNAIHEVRARGAPVAVLAIEGARTQGLDAKEVVLLPEAPHELAPFVFASALHVLSYWTAKARGLPIDRPRNLAKSVTVE